MQLSIRISLDGLTCEKTETISVVCPFKNLVNSTLIVPHRMTYKLGPLQTLHAQLKEKVK